MCGIVGVIKNKEASTLGLEALKKLEYRGYDSAGIAGVSGGKIVLFKRQGMVQNIEEFANGFEANTVILHTRWATHGKPSEVNAHPHLSFDKKLAIVHNGIIENYKEIKQVLKQKGITCLSETDTEVAVNLIASQEGSLLRKVQKASKMLKGSYAFALIEENSKEIVVAKNKSPLYIAKGEGFKMIASDLICFAEQGAEFVELLDGESAKISEDNITIYDKDFNEKSVVFEKVDEFEASAKKGGFEHFMDKEIHESPAVIKRILSTYLDKEKLEAAAKLFDDIQCIKLVACGTAYHASMYGAEVLKNATGKEATAYIASEFRYSNPIITDKTLCVFVSQSGETADTLRAAELSKSMGAKTLSISNTKTSSLARMCDYDLSVEAGKEVAVASTKAYVAQVLTLYILSRYLKDKNFSTLELDSLSQYAESLIGIDEEILSLVKNSSRVFFIGRKLDSISSLESALKLKEISYKSAEGYAAGELKHGTIALIEEGTPVFVFITDKDMLEKTLASSEEVRSRGAKVIMIARADFETYGYDYKIDLPPNLPSEQLSIISVIPLQVLAYKTALSLGYNPDRPRNLAKSVTVE